MNFKSIIIVLTVVFFAYSLADDQNPSCQNGFICFWVGQNYTGDQWRWTPRMNYRDVPRQFHNNVGSYMAKTNACFKNWIPYLTFECNDGDSSDSFTFGKVIDGVSQEC
ncbi:hypothetical protein RB653_009611 [Dictyostelium firmibasis]|uniref:Uncharacterized protein n=1 Tax=Dictyostelium firmibasis TaxID=79012 RepID=A0AAN7YXI5_9MYCE